jgi:general secretion pathway protein D
MKASTPRLAALVFAAVLAACATPGPLEQARKSFGEGRMDEALAVLQKATRENPGDGEVRAEYFRMRDIAVTQWLAQAETLRQAGRFEAAEVLYRNVQAHDAVNPRAAAGLEQIETDRRHRALVAQAEGLAKAGRMREAQDVLRPVLMENPQQRDARRLQRAIDEKLLKPAIASAQLRPTTLKPLSLELREVTLRNVFELLTRASGINFVLDRDVRADQRTTILLRDASIEEAIRMTLLTNQLEQKVLSDNTVFVYPNTPQKVREYQELVVKGFYLANADAKQTANLIRTMLKTRDIFVDDKIGLLVIKDTPAAIRLAERLIAAQDLAEPEVMLEVEVLEVNTNWLRELGLRFPDTIAWSLVGAAGTPGTVTLPEWLNRNSDLVQLTFTNPLFLLALKQQDGGAAILANPRIRVKNKEKARIHIGDRVPVITTTAAATGGFVSESVNYLDVGLKLEVEPQVFLEDEVGIRVGLEVSNIAKEITSPGSASLAYQIGTRNAATNLRLRDGETQVLAGLISTEDRRSADRVPGLGDLPVAGRLFSHTNDTRNRTEIVLLITPHLLRTLARPDASSIEFAAGTEVSTGAPRAAFAAEALAPAPVAAPPFAAPPQVAPGTQAPMPGNTMLPFGGVGPAVPQGNPQPEAPQ